MPKKIAPKAKKIQKSKQPVKAAKARKSAQAKKPVAKKAAVKKAVAKKIVAVKAPAKKPQAVKKLQAVQKNQAVRKPVAAPVQKQQVQVQVQAKAAVVAVAAPKGADNKTLYKVNNYVVYPTHGVGKIIAQETQMIGDVELKMLVISFEKDKMTLRVPMHRATAAGLRPISTGDQMKQVFVTLKSRARTSRGMWSRRAQEYETKINSGSVLSVAEVVRDLHQNVDQSERSYSERMIYESALARLVGELAAAEATDHKTATDKLMKLLRAKVAAAAAAKEAA